MSQDRLIRSALWIAVVLNATGVLIFAPAALGFAANMLPLPAPRFYAAQVAVTIALFGGTFLWLALQREIDRPLVVVGGLGKLGFFALAVAYWLGGDLPLSAAALAMPDLLLAVVFLLWAWSAPLSSHATIRPAAV